MFDFHHYLDKIFLINSLSTHYIKLLILCAIQSAKKADIVKFWNRFFVFQEIVSNSP